MLSYSKVLTKHGPFCNRTASLTKDGYLQKHVSLIINKRLFDTNVLSVKYKNVDATAKFSLTQTRPFDNKLINMKSIRCLFTRKFHTNLLLSRSINTDDQVAVKSFDTKKSHLNVNVKDLLKNEKEVKIYFEEDDKKVENTNDTNAHDHMHHSRRERVNIKDIEKIYPQPKAKVHEIYQIVNNDLKKNALSFEFKKPTRKQTNWTCTIKVLWPEETSFSTIASNKSKASYLASLKCLHFLENQKRLNKGMPILYDSKGIKDLLNRPIPLSVKSETLNDAQIIIDKYNDYIKKAVDVNMNNETIEHRNFRTNEIVDPVGKVNPLNRIPKKMEERNRLLRIRYQSRMAEYSSLPILDYRKQIIEEIKNNQVLLIKGDTGCGKTTQVPQYIMDSFAEAGAATDCNMIVAQPRRISAISLAERVTHERKEQLGDVIGYQVRLSQQLPNTPAGILFCTTGILLRKLQYNPTLVGCSHVIVDEAHERTINTDMLLVLLKRAMKENPALKVIVMSATINSELFQNYFNCKVIDVPGRTFPVKMNFMEDIDKLGLRAPSRWDLSFEDPDKMKEGPMIDIVKMGELVAWITRNKPPGAILCFLPGWSEIVALKKYLEEYSLLPKSKLMILPVHSKVAQWDQKKIFDHFPEDIRKIVLATDIAETGITVTDVVYVVDSCTHRQIRWHEKRGISSIDSYWISQANIQQRKGRAGRVKPGVSYHMITREQYENLNSYPTPEVMRTSLEKTVLDIKTYTSEKAKDFLESMPQPPAARTIDVAINDLIKLGALNYDENLTALGKRIAMFTVHPTLSKSMVFSSIFQCVAPTLTIASIMSSESDIFSGVLQHKGTIRSIKAKYHPTSDHISLAWLFEQWSSHNKQTRYASRDFCVQNRLYPDRMYTLSRVRDLNAEHLAQVHMIPNAVDFDNMEKTQNEYAELDELVRGVLLAGLDLVLYHRDFDIRKGQIKKGTCTFVMEDNNHATITPDSVNFKRKYFPSPFLTYVRRTHSEQRRTSLIRETSVISPLTVFLFSQGKIVGHLDTSNEDDVIFTVQDKKNIRLVCNKETADVLLAFRDAMWSVVRYMVSNYGLVKSSDFETFEQVQAYKVEMLQVLAKMLSEASVQIDNPVPLKKEVVYSQNKHKDDDDEDDNDDDDDDNNIDYDANDYNNNKHKYQ